jgi:hypothetical protein
MVYLKSVLAWPGWLVSVLLLCTLGNITSPGVGIPLLIVAGLIFLAGFSWEFRRATRANRPSQ